jgi:hypothetical protein
MSRRGLQVSPAPRSPGELVLFACAIGGRAEFRPKDWEATYVRLLRHELPYVREIALSHMPVPLAEPFAKRLRTLLADADVDVQIAACEVAAKTKAPSLEGPVLEVVASAKDEWLLRARYHAAADLGARLSLIQTLVARLDEEGMTSTCLNYLAGSILTDLSSYSIPTREMLGGKTARTCQAVWWKLLQDHGKALQDGRKFRLADPALPLKELFPEFSFDISKNKKQTPPPKG